MRLDLASLRAFYAGGGHPAAVVEEVYARLDRHARCGAWIYILPKDEALAQAASLPSGWSSTDLPLFGVPFSVKDNIDVAGLPTTAGCPAFSYVATTSATAVERMQAAGAMFIGKNTMDQFATGLVGIRSPVHPVNSFDPGRVPGGSSSGSAVAVALGLVSISLGSDTGGSGRVPAAFNNIVGFKPTPGIVSTAGMVYANRSFDCIPIFALYCEDAATVFDVLVGEDVRDPFLLENPGIQRTLPNAGNGLTIGVPARRDFGADADGPIAGCFDAAIDRLAAMAAVVVDVDLAPFEEAGRMVFGGPLLAERTASVGRFIAEHRTQTHPVVAEIVGIAASYRATDLIEAQHRLKFLQAEAEGIMSKIDVLAVPTTVGIPTIASVEADPIAANARLGRYTYFANPLGLCGVAVPASLRPDGLPFGICLYARKRADIALLALAAAFHGATGLRPGRNPTDGAP
jgi:allophanate hydrolase